MEELKNEVVKEVKEDEVIDAREFDPNAIYLCNTSPNSDPEYATNGASGMDLKAVVDDENSYVVCKGKKENGKLTLNPGGRALIATGLYMALPFGLEAQVRPRSGLALKKGITVLNAPGTIDCDYRGQIGVILINHGEEDFVVETGDRIAQLVLTAYAKVMRFSKVDKIEELPPSERMAGGFGHTGV